MTDERNTSHDGIGWSAYARVLKYSIDQAEYATRLYANPKGAEMAKLFAFPEDGIEENGGNLVTTLGLNRITSLIIGGGGTAMTNGSSLTGVGNVTTGANIIDTQLGANSSGNSQYVVSDAGNPSQANGTISSQATFTGTLGNFAWQEWGWVIAASPANSATFAATGTSPILVNHKIASFGTKSSAAIWVFQTSVTLT